MCKCDFEFFKQIDGLSVSLWFEKKKYLLNPSAK